MAELIISSLGSTIVGVVHLSASSVLLAHRPLVSSLFTVCAREDLLPEERIATRLFQKNNQSVVSINYHGTKPHENTLDEVEVSGYGSGFIIDSEGLILTNYHVVDVVEYATIRLWVTLADKSIYEAKVARVDKDNDIAVLHIDVAGKKLRPVHIGFSAHLLVGQNVYALGNPLKLPNSFAKGLISGLRREISSTTGYMIQDVIQIDATINPGNSGGPLFNSTGHVIGINTKIRTTARGAPTGIAFAIPIDMVVEIVDRMFNSGGINTRRRSMRQKLGVNGVLNRIGLGKRAFLEG